VLVVVRPIAVNVASNVKMRPRCVTLRLCQFICVMHVRKAQALVGQHQKDKQQSEESADHEKANIAFVRMVEGNNGDQ
jgi:hypothetical protein